MATPLLKPQQTGLPRQPIEASREISCGCLAPIWINATEPSTTRSFDSATLRSG
ncbi:hypothetical protein [Cyclonatronum proteinivorum]|uniref:hypothetical protein n=1 Tax=Cyclonatronum proteinivorum TaxID=1457365 RepID=UPI0013DF3FD8|nr:hypothetical protein [Cyclonatronum proteinivorum]